MDMPDRKQIKDLFEGLFGRDITIGDAPDGSDAEAVVVEQRELQLRLQVSGG